VQGWAVEEFLKSQLKNRRAYARKHGFLQDITMNSNGNDDINMDSEIQSDNEDKDDADKDDADKNDADASDREPSEEESVLDYTSDPQAANEGSASGF
jgi:hypothetical protein